MNCPDRVLCQKCPDPATHQPRTRRRGAPGQEMMSHVDTVSGSGPLIGHISSTEPSDWPVLASNVPPYPPWWPSVSSAEKSAETGRIMITMMMIVIIIMVTMTVRADAAFDSYQGNIYFLSYQRVFLYFRLKKSLKYKLNKYYVLCLYWIHIIYPAW